MAGTRHRPSVRHVDFEQAEDWMGRKALKKAFRVDDQAVDEELRDARGITPSGREIYETKTVGRLLGDKARADRIRQRMALKSVELRRSRQVREFRKAEQRRRNQARRRSWRRDAAENVQDYVLDHTPRKIGMGMLHRQFVLHVGPTNSGKTHDALEELMRASTGVYLAPLRLLALEVGEKMRDHGIRSSIVTGEEQDMMEADTHFSGTVEMLDINREYDVAVIDEAQMIANEDRGGAWTRAILQVRASVVHVCMSPEALDMVFQLLDLTPNSTRIIRHERATPLNVAASTWDGGFRQGDAHICFSRRQVLELAGTFERAGHRPAVVYGGLPWRARRREAAKFLGGEADVLVATDAIGMGLNLPIRRVVFHQTHKFDGRGERQLTDLEIRQIAGRAGRYGMYAEGEVTAVTASDLRRLDEALNGLPPEPCDHAYRSFDLALGMDERWPLSLIMRCWRETDQGSPFLWTQDIETPLRAAAWMERLPWEGGMPRDLECAMAFLPFDWNDPDLRDAFRTAVRALMDGGDMTWLAVQDADRTKLKSLERGLKILSFRFAFARAAGLMDDDMLTGFDAMRRQLEEALIALLDGPKSMQLTGFR